jgi:rhodanese-related sulfurtransferase
VLDVRRDVRFEESHAMLPHALRCAPEQVARFAAENAPRDVVVYCVHGLEVGAQAAADLRAAGWNARFLQGGIEGWIEAGGATVAKP